MGTIFTDLDVPDFAAPPLAMSSIMLTSVDTGGLPTGRAEQLENRLPIVPSTTRAFRPADELLLFAEIYDKENVRPHTVDFVASVLSDDRSKTVFRHQEQRSSAELAANEGRFNFGARVPLRDLKPGVYFLRLEAVSKLNAEMSVAREVPFRVEDKP
jgi:hypothetical protein